MKEFNIKEKKKKLLKIKLLKMKEFNIKEKKRKLSKIK